MAVYLLDTNHVTLLQRAGAEGANIRRRLANVPREIVATTIVCYEEQMRGWLAFTAKTRSAEKQIDNYERLQRNLEFYCAIPLLPFDEKAVKVFQRLWLARPRIGTMDLKIAAIALANDATLLTRNERDFGRVPGLRTEDWSA